MLKLPILCVWDKSEWYSNCTRFVMKVYQISGADICISVLVDLSVYPYCWHVGVHRRISADIPLLLLLKYYIHHLFFVFIKWHPLFDRNGTY